MSKRSPSQKKIDFQQSEYLKPHLSYFLFFHLGNCKKMLLSSCSCFCVGVIKKKKFWTNRDSSWNLSASGICLNFCPWFVVTGLPGTNRCPGRVRGSWSTGRLSPPLFHGSWRGRGHFHQPVLPKRNKRVCLYRACSRGGGPLMRICLFGDALPIYIIVYKQSSWRTEGINTWAKAIGKAQSQCCCSAAAVLTGKKRLSNQAERARLPSPGLAGAVAAATAALCPVFAGAPVSWLQGRACGAQTNAGLGAWGRTSCLAPSLARFACERSPRLLPAKQFINQSGIKHPLRSFA